MIWLAAEPLHQEIMTVVFSAGLIVPSERPQKKECIAS